MNIRVFGAIFLVLSIAGLLLSFQVQYIEEILSEEVTPGRPFFMILFDFYMWILFLPWVQFLVHQYPIRNRTMINGVLIPLSLSVVTVITKIALDTILFKQIIEFSTRIPERFSIMQDYTYVELYMFFLSSPKLIIQMMVYWLIFMVLFTLENLKRIQEQHLVANRLETQLAKSQLKTLQMQIHPHFLFNTLNSISALLWEDVQRADEMIRKLSDMFRYSLSDIEQHDMILDKEIQFLETYLSIERVRFQDRLSIKFIIEPESKAVYVPRMILQPLVENSIKHGIAKYSSCIEITVKSEIVKDRILLSVQDTGPGIRLTHGQPTTEGVGISSTRQRLEQVYPDDHSITFTTISPNGSLIVLDLPLHYRSRDAR